MEDSGGGNSNYCSLVAVGFQHPMTDSVLLTVGASCLQVSTLCPTEALSSNSVSITYPVDYHAM